jgi:hypothetical protein
MTGIKHGFGKIKMTDKKRKKLKFKLSFVYINSI